MIRVGLSKNTQAKQRKRGFTIIELVVVILVIGILATIGFVVYSGTIERARASETKNFALKMARGIDEYAARQGFYPSMTEINNRTQDGWLQTQFYGKRVSLDEFITPADRDSGGLSGGYTTSLYGMTYDYSSSFFDPNQYSSTNRPELRYKVLYTSYRVSNGTYYNDPVDSLNTEAYRIGGKSTGYTLSYIEPGSTKRVIIRQGDTPAP